MPKQTFYNLSVEKKERLLTAAFKEFSHVPLEEVSINAIVQNSGISRGSFYQYFEDKEDLYLHCLELLRKGNFAAIENCFQKAEGRLFEGLLLTFKYLSHHFFQGEHKEFYHQFFVNMNYRRSKSLYRSEKKEKPTALFEHISSLIDRSNLTLSTESELQEVLQFLFQIMHWTISQIFTQNLSEEEAYELMKKRLMWMANGILKEKINVEKGDIPKCSN